MREIKFRGWIGEDFIFSECVFQDNDVWRILNPNDDNWWACLEPQQFTGLKDKNGKEIYEGDIIFHEKFEEHSEILYFEKGMCFIGLPVEKEVREDYLKGHVHYLDLTCENLQISKCRVVGNIYENPELLEESK